MEKIVLDANVLFSNSLRGVFLWMQWRDVCKLIWSTEIWDEVFRNYSDYPEKERGFRQQINSAVFVNFPDSLRTLNPGFQVIGLPDENDEHVVALARQEGAEVIVTFNLRDFPERTMSGIGLRVVHPDLFLCDLFKSHSEEVKTAIREQMMALRNSKPKKSVYIEGLKRANVKEFAAVLEKEDAAGNLFSEVWN